MNNVYSINVARKARILKNSEIINMSSVKWKSASWLGRWTSAKEACNASRMRPCIFSILFTSSRRFMHIGTVGNPPFRRVDSGIKF